MPSETFQRIENIHVINNAMDAVLNVETLKSATKTAASMGTDGGSFRQIRGELITKMTAPAAAVVKAVEAQEAAKAMKGASVAQMGLFGRNPSAKLADAAKAANRVDNNLNVGAKSRHN